ncbi:hypothetical protein MGO_01490 [Candida albicans P76055]|nr:hypothetical protein MGO_01490 [Candida albicans P76055]
MYKLILLTWLCLLPIQMVSSSDSTKKLFPKTDVNDLVYFNQVFDMATKQTSDPDPDSYVENSNKTITLITLDKPPNNDTNAVDAQFKKKKGKLKPKWELNAGVYLEKKVNKKLLKKSKKKNSKKFGILTKDNGDAERILIPAELMVSRATLGTHNLFSQNSSNYPFQLTKINVTSIRKAPVLSTSIAHEVSDINHGIVEFSIASKVFDKFWNQIFWAFLYIL